jgi:hypothetical protein
MDKHPEEKRRRKPVAPKAIGGVLAAAAMLAALASPGAAAEKRRILLLDMQFDSSATAGQSKAMEAADRARLAKMAMRLSERFRASGDYEVLAAPDVAKEIANYNLGACGRCELMLGRKAGADFVMVGSVQKLSAMLMNVQVLVYAVADGSAVAAGAGVIHSNTDADWQRAIDRIAEQKLGLPDL